MGKFKNPQTITSDHPDQEDFGYSVAIHNGYVVVGDPYKDGSGSTNQGEVHVFRLERGEFKHHQKIQNPDSPEGDRFGNSVAIHDRYIVVGAYFDNNISGSVYVYRLERGEFRHHQKIQNPEPELNDDFGVSVAIHDGYIVVGAWGDSDPVARSGSFYVYRLERGEFKHLQKIQNPEPGAVDLFGVSVAIHDGYIVVGAWGDNSNKGSFYVYRLERGEFKHHQKIPNPGSGDDRFGGSVAIHDRYIVVGAWGDNDNSTDSGSVYVYHLERGEFKHLQKIQNPEPELNDRFGWSVAIRDGFIVVGAYGDDDDAGNSPGSVYVYRLDGGKFRNPQKLESPDKKADGDFGHRVAIHDGRVVVGQPNDLGTNSSNPGTAYIYSYGY